MPRYILGLDIGSNSVGSAWVDLENGTVDMGVGVFPAGVDEAEDKRGEPRNATRRMARRTRITLARRAARKRMLRSRLVQAGLLPSEPDVFHSLLEQTDPWELRRRGLREALTPYEFGRILLHLAQRRGALGLHWANEESDEDSDDDSDAAKEEGKVRNAIRSTRARMEEHRCATFGELMATLRDQRRTPITSDDRRPKRRRDMDAPREWRDSVRNQAGKFEFHADRTLIREEFATLWNEQKKHSGPLAGLLTDELRRELDDATGDTTWRHKGYLFGQRRQSWDLGTLGRCVLEPTDRCLPIADRHAGYFRVVESVNNIRVQLSGEPEEALSPEQRDQLIAFLRGPLGVHEKGPHKGKPKRSVSAADIRQLLGFGKRSRTSRISLNIERDQDREVNTDWFHRDIVHGAIGEQLWSGWDEQKKESVNRAILRFDPDNDAHARRLREGAERWWMLSTDQAERLVAAWRKRPKLEKRLNLSRRAIVNLMPFMEQFDAARRRWPTQQEARKAFAETVDDEHSRRRYATGAKGLTARDRHFMRKHADLVIPPAPMLANPVVRKAIHEVRRHIVAYVRKYGCKPDRVVIEMARQTKQAAKVRDTILARNRVREKIRNAILDDFDLSPLTLNQQRAAVDRVLLARQQNETCPYCGHPGLTERKAANGEGCEIDHIVPYSRCGDNGLNNKVLVHTGCNRDKQNHTPREWWGECFDDNIRLVAARFKQAAPQKGDYFTKRDYARKWHNFTREVRERDEWKNSQLTDTAYAARQVMAYLADALFDGKGLPERGGERKIFATQGRYTAMLRRDWRLFDTLRPSREDGKVPSPQEELAMMEKDRGDHRHHAIDAAVIALTDPHIILKVARRAMEEEAYRHQYGQWPKRTPIPPPEPWENVERLRAAVMAAVYGRGHRAGIVVAHRPVKTKLVGALHKATQYGPVFAPHGALVRDRVTLRQAVFDTARSHIKPAHLRLPTTETRNMAVERLSAQYQSGGLGAREARAKARAVLDAPGYEPKLVEPPPTSTGIVRDPELRRTLRAALRDRGIDPDSFTAKDLKETIDEDGPLCHPSGVPIRRVVLLCANNDPVAIRRRTCNPVSGQMEPSADPRTVRLYDSQNNHHVEIRADARDRWSGFVVRTIEAAKRVRNNERPAVDRSDDPARGGSFVMSLAEGETVYMKHPKTGAPDYFVVFKLKRYADGRCRSIHFINHTDARPSRERKDMAGNVVPGSARDDVAVTVATLRGLAPPGHSHPVKVRVDPIGQVKVLNRD